MTTKDDLIAGEGTLTQGDLRLTMHQEEELDIFDPRDNTNVGAMICSHKRYDLGDKAPWAKEYLNAVDDLFAEEPTLGDVMGWLKRTYGAIVVLPLYLLDHSGLSMRAGRSFADIDPGEWDSGLVGFIFDTPKSRDETGVGPDHVEQALRAEVREYDSWLQGDVWSYAIERKTICSVGAEHWETVEACGGFIGYDWAAQAAADAWDCEVKEA
jgi:hypothetical protein